MRAWFRVLLSNACITLTQNYMKKILVLCTGNSCRSQIAEGYLRHFAGNAAEIFSAGVETHGVNPRAIATVFLPWKTFAGMGSGMRSKMRRTS